MSEISWSEEDLRDAFGPNPRRMIEHAELIAHWLGNGDESLDHIGADEIVVMAKDLARDLRELLEDDADDT
jgi:hypothetical protein